jgi:chromosome partitioning protein
VASRCILVVNSKGGCGKSTLTSNLASYYAQSGDRVGLVDLDRQMSSIRWLQRRPEDRPAITGITGWERHNLPELDWVIMDPPAQIQRKDIVTLTARADVVLIPVLPSPIDIQAAADFIRDLLIYAKVRTSGKPVAVIANRARTNTFIFDELKKFLAALDIPFIATLRDSQNYIHAACWGIGVFEMIRSITLRDREQWQPVVDWIENNVQHEELVQRPHLRVV